MKSFLIKLGKISNVLREEGFFRGGKRVLKMLAGNYGSFLKSKKGDILLITSGLGDSALYRNKHYAEELEINGFECATTTSNDPFVLRYADKFKIFIFHRVDFSDKIKKLVEKIKKQKKEIIFETDDLVFDAELFKQTDSYKSMNALQKMQYEKGVGSDFVKDSYVKVCTTTTSFLAEKLREYGKKVFIVPNKLSQKDLEITNRILKNPKREDEKIKIGYFGGTFTHNKDFATITDALMAIMENYPQVELYLAGPLNVESKLNKFKDRIKQFPYVPRENHFANMYKVDINLAPLVLEDPFCIGKSELKFFSPGILKVPTVAVRNQTFSEAITDGVDGFLADNTDEWVEKISKLVESENLRREMGEKAREKALQDYTTENSHGTEYYEYLRKKIGVIPASEPESRI